MIRVRWIAISFVMRQRCFPHIGMFSFLHRESINLPEGRLRNKMRLHYTLKGFYFVLKDFDQSQESKTIAKKSLQFICSPHRISLLFKVRLADFVIVLMEDGWKVRMNIRTALWSFVNFCCLSQSEVSTDNRKVSTFFAFQQVHCLCCYRSYLDRFLILNCRLGGVTCELSHYLFIFMNCACSFGVCKYTKSLIVVHARFSVTFFQVQTL